MLHYLVISNMCSPKTFYLINQRLCLATYPITSSGSCSCFQTEYSIWKSYHLTWFWLQLIWNRTCIHYLLYSRFTLLSVTSVTFQWHWLQVCFDCSLLELYWLSFCCLKWNYEARAYTNRVRTARSQTKFTPILYILNNRKSQRVSAMKLFYTWLT